MRGVPVDYGDPPSTADLVVIGGGVLGAATAFSAARRGRRTVVLETRARLCTLTTPAATGAFRAQFDNPEETRLVLESIAAFTSFGDHLEIPSRDADIGLRQPGYLWLTTTDEGRHKQAELVEQQRGWGLTDVELLDGDAAAVEALALIGRNLGVGIASLLNIFNPDLVVIGGGVSAAGDLLLTPAREEFQRRALPSLVHESEVVAASLGNDAGVLGAAALVL
jgi:hypothetical protein